MTGNDLIELGFEPRPALGLALRLTDGKTWTNNRAAGRYPGRSSRRERRHGGHRKAYRGLDGYRSRRSVPFGDELADAFAVEEDRHAAGTR